MVIRLADVDFKRCQIRIDGGKGDKSSIVPLFPEQFKQILSMHVKGMKGKGATHLFESSGKKQYADHGIRKILQKYATAADFEKTMSLHKLRHFLFTWLKKNKDCCQFQKCPSAMSEVLFSDCNTNERLGYRFQSNDKWAFEASLRAT